MVGFNKNDTNSGIVYKQVDLMVSSITETPTITQRFQYFTYKHSCMQERVPVDTLFVCLPVCLSVADLEDG